MFQVSTRSLQATSKIVENLARLKTDASQSVALLNKYNVEHVIAKLSCETYLNVGHQMSVASTT
jgi:hypothetical protein